MKKRISDLVAEYGTLAIVIHLVMLVLCIVGFAVALKMGVEVKGVAGEGGIWVAAYAGAQIIKPFRFGATLVLTPVAAAWMHRIKGPRVPTVDKS